MALHVILIAQAHVWIKDDDARSILDHLLVTACQTWARRNCAAAAFLFGYAPICVFIVFDLRHLLNHVAVLPLQKAWLFVNLLAGQRRHRTVATQHKQLISRHIRLAFDVSIRWGAFVFVYRGRSRCMFAAMIRCCIMAAVAKDTDTCVSPGHVSSAILPNMFCFSMKGPWKRLIEAWCL